MESELDLEKIVLSRVTPRVRERQAPPSHKSGKKFLKGPIPYRWLEAAFRLPGRTLHVGIQLWFLAGMNRSGTVPLSLSRFELLGISRHAATRGLAALERAGLVSVVRRAGRRPIVTLQNPGDECSG